MRIIVFANTYSLVSGGDVIFVEMCKIWSRMGHHVEIITNEKGKEFCEKHKFPGNKVTLWKASIVDHFRVFIAEIWKTVISSVRTLFLNGESPDVIFASSFFWPDIFSAVLAKIKYPKAKLVVGIYLLFPNPLGKIRYSGGYLKAFALSISQLVSLHLTRVFSDIVLTASRHKSNLLYNGKQLNEDTVVAIRGGVDTQSILRTKNQRKKFDCLYYGRFHSQKGLFDLLEIWKSVLTKKPKSKLLLAGGGPLESELRERAFHLGILSSITFSGILSGSKKYKLLKTAKIFVSSSRFDTGNIALDEVLACGVPGVVYDLPYLHYEAGVVKIPVGNKKKMTKEILKLLENRDKRLKLGKEGRDFIRQYDWHKVSKRVMSLFLSSTSGI